MGGERDYFSSYLLAMFERRSVCDTYPLILRFEGLDDSSRDT